MQIGELCKIWNGKSSISETKNWLIGIVVKEEKNVNCAEARFQVLWNDGMGIDQTWYSSSDIRFDQ